MSRAREVRLALVLNGGVSLAVWIGGVTREIDAARRRTPAGPTDTAPLYNAILEALDETLVVDVIGGASAGGINGVLLGAAIYNGKPLDLRETWISLGDFRRLLRSPAVANPPSLLQGDDVVLAELRERLDDLWTQNPHPDQRALFVYVTATDLFGYPVRFRDSEDRRWQERDHRRVFQFRHVEEDVSSDISAATAPPSADRDVMPRTVSFSDANAKELLARAARSSSSFPVAFEAHGLRILDADDAARDHWLVDGGILDNQPFNPVLDRIAVLPSDTPVKRVVMYVVPYVTEPRKDDFEAPVVATARDTYMAASALPRDLPKLQSLQRITSELDRQQLADAERAALFTSLPLSDLGAAAASLFEKYRATRFAGTRAVYRLWNSPRFPAGDGMIAQDAAVDPRQLVRLEPPGPVPEGLPWIPDVREWSPKSPTWMWGLSPAERVAGWALLFLQDAATPQDDFHAARVSASWLIVWVRKTKVALREAYMNAGAFAEEPGGDGTTARARIAYAAIAERLTVIQAGFAGLEPSLLAAKDIGVQALLNLEVTKNAFGTQDLAAPLPFDFVFASAGVKNSLGHPARSPERKLAGMKLNHFGGFLKRSWRANDWLWGRLDGVEHVLTALIDKQQVVNLSPDQLAALADVAFPPDASGEEGQVLAGLWRDTLANLGLPATGWEGGAHASFIAVIGGDSPEPKRLHACRRALAARIQLRILKEDLGRVAETARDDLLSGSSRIAAGAFWAGRFPRERQLGERELLGLFKDLEVGEETLQDEASSRLVLDVGSQLAAVAAALVAGDRGGVPVAARGALASVRGVTLASSRLLRLLAREPWVGAAAFAVVAGLVAWAATSHNTVIGALFPALALLGIVMGVSLLTIATSVFEQSATTIARAAGFILLAGVPLGFALVMRWPEWSAIASGWLDRHMSETATTTAAVLGLVAAGAAVTRLVAGIVIRIDEQPGKSNVGRGWIRTVLGTYRVAIVAALITLGTGFIVTRTLNRHSGSRGWVSLVDERRGTVLVLALVGVLLFAGLVEETSAWIRSGHPLDRARRRAARLRAELVSRVLAVVSLAGSIVALVWDPLLVSPFAVLLALIASGTAPQGARLPRFAVAVGAICFLAGMTIAVTTNNPLY